MLTYEALLEQARTRGMPKDKMRGALREYLQFVILKEMYRHEAGKKMYFTGGTYLRLVHNLKRFSEDLDFNTDKIRKDEFENLLKLIKTGLKRINMDPTLDFDHWRNIYSARMIFPEIESYYGISSKYSKKEGIIIKIETNRPRWKIKKEALVISGFGEIYPCVCTDIGALFADKIDALDKKRKARHLYDIIFMLANKYQADKSVLAALGIRKEPPEAIIKVVSGFSGAELKKMAESLRPFLFDESEAGLIVNARKVIPDLISKIKGP